MLQESARVQAWTKCLELGKAPGPWSCLGQVMRVAAGRYPTLVAAMVRHRWARLASREHRRVPHRPSFSCWLRRSKPEFAALRPRPSPAADRSAFSPRRLPETLVADE